MDPQPRQLYRTIRQAGTPFIWKWLSWGTQSETPKPNRRSITATWNRRDWKWTTLGLYFQVSVVTNVTHQPTKRRTGRQLIRQILSVWKLHCQWRWPANRNNISSHNFESETSSHSNEQQEKLRIWKSSWRNKVQTADFKTTAQTVRHPPHSALMTFKASS